MEPLLMLQTATALFAIAALGGVLMAGIRLGAKRNPPIWLAMLHGLLGGAGLTLLAYAVCMADVSRNAGIALALLLLAAIGGIAMNLGYHWKQQPLPVGLLVGHAALAVIGFALLAFTAFGGG
jgi:hypothetical protein